MHGKTVERIFMIHLAHCSQYANEMGREILVTVEPGQYLIWAPRDQEISADETPET